VEQMLRSCPLFLAADYFPLRYLVSKRLVIQTVEILTGKGAIKWKNTYYYVYNGKKTANICINKFISVAYLLFLILSGKI